MSKLAGIFYFDGRPICGADETQVYGALGDREGPPIQLCRGQGLVMGHAASPFDFLHDEECSVSSDGSICTWDGRLDNREDLLIQLSCDWPQAPTDSAFALKLYQTKGADGFRDLIGDWSLAIWDGGSRSVQLASDYAGIRPLYYYRGVDRLLWSSSLADLVGWTGINQLDEEYVASFLTHGSAAHRTPYRGIYSVPPGHVVGVSQRRDVTRPFWDLPIDQEIRFQDERCYEDQLRTLFREAVSVRLRTPAPACAELSGGLDSSSIVCMVDHLRKADSAGLPDLITFSYTHRESTDERYFRAVERACGLSGIHLQLDEYPLTAPNRVGEAAPGWWEPRFRELARRMEAIGSGVFLTGQLGDFIMGNSTDDTEQVADYLQQGQLLRAAREAFSWSQSLRIPIYSILWRALRMNYSSWAAPSVAKTMCDRYGHIDSLAPDFRRRVALSENKRQQELRWQAAGPGRRRRLRTLSEMLQGRLLQAPEPLQHVSYTHPYAHRPLVEFMLTIPAAVVCRPGEPRRLMRRAFAGLLPPPIVRRKSKASYERVYRQALLPMAEELLKRPGEMRLVEFGFVDRQSITERLTRFTEGLDCNECQLRQIILFEYWLRNGETPGDSVLDEAVRTWVN